MSTTRFCGSGMLKLATFGCVASLSRCTTASSSSMSSTASRLSCRGRRPCARILASTEAVSSVLALGTKPDDASGSTCGSGGSGDGSARPSAELSRLASCSAARASRASSSVLGNCRVVAMAVSRLGLGLCSGRRPRAAVTPSSKRAPTTEDDDFAQGTCW
eukprot:scaffold1199_cov265-Pinguiococcus_pyrenoidosus.AAC.37